MRKIVIALSISFVFLTSQQVTAQNDAYNIGDKTVSFGLTLGGYGYGYAGNRALSFPPIILAGEYGFHEYVSAGAYVGFASYRYDYTFGEYSRTYISLGAKASFHYVPLLNENLELDIDEEKFDFYISVIPGIRISNYKSDNDFFGLDTDNTVNLVFGPYLGFKYMITEQIGVFVEPGWNALGYFTFGASARF